MGPAGDLVRAFLETVWNGRDLAAFPRFVAQEVRFHPPRGPARTYGEYLSMANDMQRAFPDLHFDIRRVLESGDLVAVELVIAGTNRGPFRGRPPTGRAVRVVGRPWARVEGGRIVELWQLFDELGMLFALGHIDDAALVPGASLPPG